jgi:hypothetical protein
MAATTCTTDIAKNDGPRRAMTRWAAWAERWKPAAGIRAHLVAAAGLWTVVGLGLTAAGLAWCSGIALPWSAVLAAVGLAAGLVKGRYVIRRMAERNAARIIARGDGRCLGGFLSVKTWLLVAAMMASGMALRRSPVPRPVLGVVYTAVGTALLAGSAILWRALRARAQGP